MSTVAPDWVPEFPGQRPPFAEGNEVAVKHGASAPRRVEELARKVNSDLLDRAPWVAGYAEALAGYARAEAVARLLFSEITRNGINDKDGTLRASLLARYNAAENSAAKHREALGLTPRSEAQVARDRADAAATAVSLADIAARGLEAVASNIITPITPITAPEETNQ